MKRRNGRLTSIVLAAAMSFTFSSGSFSAYAQDNGNDIPKELKQLMMDKLQGKIEGSDEFTNSTGMKKDKENSALGVVGNPEEVVRVIVELEAAPATLMLPDGEQPTEEMLEKVKSAQLSIQRQVEAEAEAEIKHTFGNLINGFSAEVKRKDIEKIKAMDGVADVEEARIYYPTMNTAKKVTEALDVWQDYGYKGEGLVVSVIDSGIDYTHKDMRLSDPSKAKLDEEDVNKGPGKFYSDKVPYGYNFADENDNIIDNTGSMHGQHVAGIVAANATDEEVENNAGIQGVAPEAQVLAMRVFSDNANNPGAYSDDIIAAIEASVELEADVINMSLGSNSGYRDELLPEQAAIKNATDDGVICVVAAGNAATSLDPYVIDGIYDISTAGSPATAKDALMVASSDNSFMRLPSLNAYINDKEVSMGYTQAAVEPTTVFSPDAKLELVDCGFGSFGEVIGKNLAGKIALISRGNNSFADKQIYAQIFGAAGVIIYNNTDGYVNMVSHDALTIPAIFISQADGEMLKSNLSEARVSFKGEMANIPIGDGLNMSDFTSWGPTPTLDFAPQITAPGGSIYSTLNDNQYGTMSGTSMATPHTAGATALILQGLKENGINLQGRELVEFVRKTIINTAETLTETNQLGEEKIPYSPRRQGSGMVQTKAAIDNRVLITGEDGEATVALKEIGEKTEFTLTLKNYSNKEEAYNIESFGGVLTAFAPSMLEEYGFQVMAFDTVLEGASLGFDKEKVVVPANGETTVKVTLNVPADAVKDNFVEGFIKFNAVNENTPSLVVPYMGFYGNWDAQKIIDGAIWDMDNVTVAPSFGATLVYGEYNYLGFEGRVDGQPILNPDKMAISPNEDMVGDEFIPVLYFLRNAKDVRVDVLDENKNVIGKSVEGESNLIKKIFGDYGGDSADVYDSLAWDGTVYDKHTGQMEVVPDGQYYLNFRAKIDGENREYKDFIMPVKVDTKKVKTTIVSEKRVDTTNYTLEFEFDGDLAKDSIAQLLVRVNGIDIGYTGADGPFEIPGAVIEGDKLSVDVSSYMIQDEVNYVQVVSSDYAYNLNYEMNTIEVGKCTATAQIVGFAEGQFIPSDEYRVYGEYSGPVGKILINGEPAEMNYDGIFTKTVKLVEGRNTITLYAEDVYGNVIANNAHKLYSDMTAPTLNLTAPYVNEENQVITASNTITLKGNVEDNLAGYEFEVNGEEKLNVAIPGGEGKDTYRDFEYEVPVEDGDMVTLRLTDLAGNETVKQFTVKVLEEILPEINIAGVVNGKSYNTEVTPVITVSPEDFEYEVTLNGESYKGEAISAEGSYELVVKAKGSKETEVVSKVSFEIDKTAPVINVSGVENSKVYNTNVMPKIEAESGTTVTATLNDEVYEGIAIVEEGSYVLKVTATDKAGNITETVVNFEIDKTAPTVTVEGLVDGMKYDKEVKPVITIEEGAEAVITLNDKPYNGEVIKAEGTYVLKVTAKDAAGNTTERVYEFKIEKPKGPGENPTPDPENPDPEKPNPDDDKVTDDNKDDNKTDKLPQTGGAAGSMAMMAMGAALATAGVLAGKKRNRK